ncbi:MAG: hypothetical protein DNFNHJIP_00036 [Candidatus Argoarchaeum ethanivorans]|uniref:Uncharacterized protein n=1 Tax=Candidatus Argoarchaeum ethanivorans TaxID=2608793 RepID=A0A811ZZG2_9EURY|nr:MAG: hypothetical protein DNFNHJIP_00036 [Candidatus Argoarchaeum ethanivorans]
MNTNKNKFGVSCAEKINNKQQATDNSPFIFMRLKAVNLIFHKICHHAVFL